MDLSQLFSSLPLIYWICLVGLMVLLIYCQFKDGNATVKGGKHRVENGPLGNADFASEKELSNEYKTILFNPQEWRKNPDSRPTEPGLLLGDWHKGGKKNKKMKKPPYYYDEDGNWNGGEVYTRVFTEDQNAAMIAAAGSGKTSFVLAAQLEYNLACGIPIVTTDTKGDIVDKWGPIAKNYYGYKIVNFDLGHPLRSDRFNILGSVNKYVDLYNACPEKKGEEALGYLAKAESYAKAAAKTIIMQGNDGNFGANAFFYDAAEGLLQASILLISEYAKPEERHILSVYNLLQQVSGTEVDENGQKISQVKLLLDKLPPNSKIRLFAGSAAQGGDSQASVLSTALSRLLSFLDSEIEPMICGDSDLDVKAFAENKTIVFLTVPEEQENRYFLVSLIVQEIYNELLELSRENGNKVPVPEGFKGKPGTQRVEFLLDEIGTLPPIKGMEKILSAGRSRRIFVFNIVQTMSQMDKNYGKQGSDIIWGNSKLLFVAGLAPLSSDISRISDVLGKYTIETNSASTSNKPNGGTNKSRSVQMSSIDLMSKTEIQQELGLGKVLIIRSGEKPILSHYDLFLDWGIDLSEPPLTFEPKKAGDTKIANKENIITAIEEENEGDKHAVNMAKAQERAEAQKKADAEREEQKKNEQEKIANVDTNFDYLDDGLEHLETSEYMNPYSNDFDDIPDEDDEEDTEEAQLEKDFDSYCNSISELFEDELEDDIPASLIPNEEDYVSDENEAETSSELAQDKSDAYYGDLYSDDEVLIPINISGTSEDDEIASELLASLTASLLETDLVPTAQPVSLRKAAEIKANDEIQFDDEEEEDISSDDWD